MRRLRLLGDGQCSGYEDEDEECTTTALYYDGSQDLSSHDASKCREYHCASHDGDCCGYDYETWCADGYTLVRGNEGEHDCWPGKKGYRCLPSEYFVGDYSTSYDDAKTYCAERDASLVTIHSQAENEAAYSACIAGGMRNCWLGLEAYGSEWYWHTGEALSWTNWDGSEGTCFAARTAPSSRLRGTAISGTTFPAATARTRTRFASAAAAQPQRAITITGKSSARNAATSTTARRRRNAMSGAVVRGASAEECMTTDPYYDGSGASYEWHMLDNPANVGNMQQAALDYECVA